MAGKMPSSFKERSNAAMPYARRDQGLLYKVASKFKNMFIPAWLVNWMKTEEIEEIENIHSLQMSMHIEGNDNPTEMVHKQNSVGNSRCRNINNITAASPTSFWPGPSTSREPNVASTKGTGSLSSISNCDMRSTVKNDSRIVNGDDHSENSDNSASSGCSSLIPSQEKAHCSTGLKINDCALEELRAKLMQKSTQMQKSQISTGLFSNSSSGVEASNSSCVRTTSTQRRVFPRPSRSNRPAFNVSSYGKPSLVNDSNSIIASPFYNGSTTVGGSSAYRRSNTPYTVGSEVSRNQFRLRQRVPDNIPCISSDSSRVLHCLQSMNTPLNDAKKLPVDFSSSLDNPLILNPPGLRFQSLDRSKRVPGGPPPVNLKTISKVSLLKNRNSRTSKNLTMEIPTKPHLTSEECAEAPGKIEFDQVMGGNNMKCIQESLGATKARPEYMSDYELPGVSLKMSPMPVCNKSFQKTVENVMHEKSGCTKSNNLKADKSSVYEPDDMNPNILKSNEQEVSAQEFDALQFKFSKPIERRNSTLLQKFLSDAVVHFKFKEPIDHRDSQPSAVPLQANMNSKCSCINNLSAKNSLKTKGCEIEESEVTSVPPCKKILLNESVNKPIPKMAEISEERAAIVGDNRNAVFSKASSVTSAVPLSKPMKYAGKEIKHSDSQMPSTSSANGPILQKTSNSRTCDTCSSKSSLFTNQCATCGNIASSVSNDNNKLRESHDKSTSFTFPSLVSTTVPTSNIKFETSDPTAKLDTEIKSSATKIKFDALLQTSASQVLMLGDSKPKTSFANSSKPVEEEKLGVTVSSNSLDKSSLIPSKSVEVTTAKPQEGFKFVFPTKHTTDKIFESTKSNEVIKSNSSVLNITEKNPEITPSILPIEKTKFIQPTSTKSEIKFSVPNSGFDGFKSVTTTAACVIPLDRSEKSNNTCVSNLGKITSVSTNSSLKNSSTYERSSYSTMKTQTLNSNPFGKVEFDTNTTSSISTFASTFPPKNTSVSFTDTQTVRTSELFSKNIPSKHLQPSSGPDKNPKGDKLEFPSTSESSKVSQVISTTESPRFTSAQFSFKTSSFNNPFTTPILTKDKPASVSTSSTLPTTQTPTSTNSTSSGFVFGNQNSTLTNSSFGSTSFITSTSTTTPKNSAIFTFGTATDSAKRVEGFSFKSEKTKKQNITPSFGKAGNFSFVPSSSQPPGGFSLANLKSTETTSPATFSFGPAAVTTTTFSPFQLPQTTTTSISTFSFGNKSSSTTTESSAFKPSSTGGFQFGLKPSENTSTRSSFLSSNSFGTNSIAPTFGASQTTGGFNFGSPVSPNTTLPFTFASPSAKKQATGTPPTNEFRFSLPRNDANGGFPPNFNISTPPNFNFGAASTPTNQPFHFAATAASNVTAPPQAARKFRKAVRRGSRREN